MISSGRRILIVTMALVLLLVNPAEMSGSESDFRQAKPLRRTDNPWREQAGGRVLGCARFIAVR